MVPEGKRSAMMGSFGVGLLGSRRCLLGKTEKGVWVGLGDEPGGENSGCLFS